MENYFVELALSTYRRTLQRRVYVDDDLPAFLKHGHTSSAVQSAPIASALMPPQAIPPSVPLSGQPRPANEAPQLPAIIHSKPRYDARFVLRLAVLTLAVNAMLFVLLSGQHQFASQRMSLQSARHNTLSAPLALEDRVLTYSATSSLSVAPADKR